MNLNHIKAFFFDLDGTLVDSKLNFDQMREDLGFPTGVPILEHIESLPTQSQKINAHKVVLNHELNGAKNSILISGVKELLSELASKSIPMGILTRNCRKATDIMLKMHDIKIDQVITREDFPPKPDPSALLHLANHFSVDPAQCIYIGDFKFDIIAAQNAGMQSALYDPENKADFKDMANYSFASFEAIRL